MNNLRIKIHNSYLRVRWKWRCRRMLPHLIHSYLVRIADEEYSRVIDIQQAFEGVNPERIEEALAHLHAAGMVERNFGRYKAM
jgi:hypothetical protein